MEANFLKASLAALSTRTVSTMRDARQRATRPQTKEREKETTPITMMQPTTTSSTTPPTDQQIASMLRELLRQASAQ